MNKEALTFILDVGPSMWRTKDKTGLTRLDKAIKAVSLMIQQKIIDGRKTDAISLILFGCDCKLLSVAVDTKNPLQSDGDYQNIAIIQDFQPADLNLIRYLHSDLALGNHAADCLDALVVGADMLIQFTGTKKYEKRIFIFTDAASPINDEGLSEIVAQIKKSEATIDIIGLDFELEEKDKVKVANEKLLYSVADSVGGNVFPITEALQILNHFMKKRVRSATSYKGSLEIAGDLLPIQIQAWARTCEMKLPTAKKLSAIAERSAAKETMVVERSVSYFTKEEAPEIVEKDHLVKAYRYGKSLIPFHKVDEVQLALVGERSMKLIGFVPLSQIDRASIMQNVFAVAADVEDSNAGFMLSAFIRGMYEKESAALVRYVRVKNANPRLGVLIPHIKSSYECLHFSFLPFAEDVRRYTFSSFPKKPLSKEQLAAMEEWIKEMDLMTAALDEEGAPMEAFKPKDTFNPACQRLFQCIQHRVMNPTEPLPDIDPQLLFHIQPIPSLFKKAGNSFENVRNEFKLEKVEKAESKRVWGAADQSDLDKLLGLTNGTKKSNVPNLEGEKGENRNPADEDETVRISSPIEDFEAMIRRNNKDVVLQEAIEQMCFMITTLVVESLGTQLFPKAINCLVSLRNSCIKESETAKFNSFLKDLRDRFGHSKRHLEFWNMIVANDSINLITREESSDSLLTKEDAIQFKMPILE